MTLRESFSSLISHIVDRLSGDKIFRNSLILNIKEFINDFKALNIKEGNIKMKIYHIGVLRDDLRRKYLIQITDNIDCLNCEVLQVRTTYQTKTNLKKLVVENKQVLLSLYNAKYNTKFSKLQVI